jgi:adenosine deaminase
VTINSDDPAYFGGYVADNYIGTAAALGLSAEQMIQVARNSFVASFLPEAEQQHHLAAIDALVSN